MSSSAPHALKTFSGCIRLRRVATSATFHCAETGPESSVGIVGEDGEVSVLPIELVLQTCTPFCVTEKLKLSPTILDKLAARSSREGATVLASLMPANLPGAHQPAEDGLMHYLSSRGVGGVAHIGGKLKVHFIPPCTWTQLRVEALGLSISEGSDYLLALVTGGGGDGDGVVCLSPSPLREDDEISSPPFSTLLDFSALSRQPSEGSVFSPSHNSLLSPSQPRSWRPSGHCEHIDDCGGDVKACEARIFSKLLEAMARSNLKDVFKRLNKRGNGEISVDEWVDGMRTVVHCKCSESMLTKVYKSLDLGEDHLGTGVKSKYQAGDNSLSYLELLKKIEEYRRWPRGLLVRRNEWDEREHLHHPAAEQARDGDWAISKGGLWMHCWEGMR